MGNAVPSRADQIRRALVVVLAAVVAGTALATAVAFAGALSWVADLFSHFRVQYLVVALICTAGAGLAGARWLAMAATAVALVNGLVVAPELGGRTPTQAPAGSATLHVLVANVHTANTQHQSLARVISDRRPEVVALVEVDDSWLRDLAPALTGYARIAEPRGDNFGIALFSRLPMHGRVESLTEAALPTIVATIEHDGAAWTFAVCHPPPPLRDFADVHAAELSALAARLRAQAGGRVAAVGDFNTTPWSARYRRFVRESELRDSRRDFGLQTSFPVGNPLLSIPIDHAFVGAGVAVLRREVLFDIGSDHYPIWLELAAVSPAAQPE